MNDLRYTIEVIRLDDGTFQAVIEDWYSNAGYGATAADAMIDAVHISAVGIERDAEREES